MVPKKGRGLRAEGIGEDLYVAAFYELWDLYRGPRLHPKVRSCTVISTGCPG